MQQEQQDQIAHSKEKIVAYDETSSRLTVLSKDHIFDQDKLKSAQNIQPTSNPEELFALGESNLFLTAHEVITSHYSYDYCYELKLYTLCDSKKKKNKNKFAQTQSTDNDWPFDYSSFCCVDKFQSAELINSLCEFSFNKKRGLLAGLHNYSDGVLYYLWKPDYQGFNLRRKTKNKTNENGGRIDTEIVSLDFTLDGEKIATLSENYLLSVRDVNSNLIDYESAQIRPVYTEGYEDSYKSCRWNYDSTKIITLSANPQNALGLVDPEKNRIINSSSQREFWLRTLDVSVLNPYLVACGLKRDGQTVIFDTRASLYFPVQWFNYNKKIDRKLAVKKKKNKGRLDSSSDDDDNESGFIDKPQGTLLNGIPKWRFPVKWSNELSHELMCKTLHEINITDTRNCLSIKIADAENYSAACFVS